MLKGNKGDWSEVYVFLKLLADGRLNAADANLDIIPTIYYPIIKILREEGPNKREYHINGSIKVFDGNTNSQLLDISITEFTILSKKLFDDLKISSGLSIKFPEIESFLKSIHVNTVSASSQDKADIRIVVHDLNTGMKPTLGFSIKSMLGGKSTLFNPGAGTNFIFEIELPSGSKLDVDKFNKETYKSKDKRGKISVRINELEKIGGKLIFRRTQSEILQLNLKLIDSDLPDILAHLLYYRFKAGIVYLSPLMDMININNPMKYNLSEGHPFYEYKLRNFVTDSALGMTAETVWTGVYDATGGIIIVKKTGDIVCYHIYNRKEFQDYLISNSYLEQPATSEDEDNPGHVRIAKEKIEKGEKKEIIKPYKYGWVYEEADRYFIKLNLQIRFS